MPVTTVSKSASGPGPSSGGFEWREIDTRPPEGARCERRIVTRYVTFLLQHNDLPSLLAGKLHAATTRKYAKGRDWYDLMWYLSQRPPVAPNLPLLQAALLG
jgi:hypothetical protein